MNLGGQLQPIPEGDVSTIGVGDWDDNETVEQTASVANEEKSFISSPSNRKDGNAKNELSLMGEIGAEEIEQDKNAYFAANQLIVDGFKCPDEFLEVLTPMEFEEMVTLFVTFDSNKSGTIDKHEAKKILQFLGMHATLEKAENLLNLVDVNNTGEIGFEDFCKFIVLIKRGDDRFVQFSSMLTKIGESPLFELERQVKSRDLKINFLVVEERKATVLLPPTFVVEV